MHRPRPLLAALIVAVIFWTGTGQSADGQDALVLPTTSPQRLPPLAPGIAGEQNGEEPLSEIIQDRAGKRQEAAPIDGLRKWLAEDADPDTEAERNEREEKEASSRNRSTTAHVQHLRKPIGEIEIEASEAGRRIPDNRAARFSPEAPQITIGALGFSPPLPNRYTVGFTHRPLYFEQPNLERCGRGCGYLQNAVSGVQFCASTMCLPYHVCAERADCPVPAGGDCMTCQTYPVDCNPFPLDRHAVVTQAAAIAGFSFLLL